MEFEPLGICFMCRHKRQGTTTCDAFPNGIPKKFLDGKAFHLEPERNDRGFQFAPRPPHTLEKAKKKAKAHEAAVRKEQR